MGGAKGTLSDIAHKPVARRIEAEISHQKPLFLGIRLYFQPASATLQKLRGAEIAGIVEKQAELRTQIDAIVADLEGDRA